MTFFSETNSLIENTETVFSIINTIITCIGVLMAYKWLRRRNLERAHDAANDFLDEMTAIELKVLTLEIEVVRTVNTIRRSIEHEIDTDYVKECLTMMNKATLIRLSFFNKYERIHRRNVKIKPAGKYKELEEHLINYTSFLSKIFQTAADGFCKTENTDDLKSIFNELNAHRENINIMTKNLSIACGRNQGITFNEYFSF
ncbi:hypothetical protein ACSLWN_22440 [Salmonella enterica]|nr:hypothetical protein [Salmonella enterica]GAR53171.1 hypothetical protein NGUA13_03692 [Salmonella enterica]